MRRGQRAAAHASVVGNMLIDRCRDNASATIMLHRDIRAHDPLRLRGSGRRSALASAAPARARGRRTAGARRSRGRGRRRTLPGAAGRAGPVGRHRAQLSGRDRRQPVGRQRRPRRDRLRRRPVPPGRRHEPARVAARRPQFRAVRRAGPRDRARARARAGRHGAHRHAEHAGGAHAAGPVPHRRRRRIASTRSSPCAKARPTVDTGGGRAAGAAGPERHAGRPRSAQYAQMRNGVGTDGFDTWSANRDRYYERGRADAPVSRQMVGYADLDQYGAWETAPEYGAVWYPANVSPRLGAVSRRYWTDVAGVGPDVGRRRAVGLCAVPLRPLGVHPRPLGMVSGRLRRAAGVGAGAGGMGRRPGLARPGRSAGRSTAGCRWAGASPTSPAGGAARAAAGSATTGRTR